MRKNDSLLRQLHLPTLWMGAGTVFAGSAAAVVRGNMDLFAASLCVIFAAFAQLSSNFIGNYMTMKRDLLHEERPRFEGSKPRYNPLTVRLHREGAAACLLICCMAGFGLLSMCRQWAWVLAVGGAVFLSIYLLNVGKHPLFKTPWVILFTFLLFGPLGVMTTSLLQSQREAIGSIWDFFDMAPSLFLGPATGLMALSVHFLYSYLNYRTDPRQNDRSMTKNSGPKAIEFLTAFDGFAMFGLMVWMVLALHISQPLLAIVPAFIGCSFNLHIATRMRSAGIAELRHLVNMAIVNYLLFTLLTWVFCWIIAPPDDSAFQIF